jgi:cation transport ATPase
MSSGFTRQATELHVTRRRVRVQSSLMKRDADRARRAEQSLAALPGVAAARVNPTTGSIVLHFEPAQWTADTLLAHLRERGYLHRPSSRQARPTRQQRGREMFTGCCVLIAKELLGAAISEVLPSPLVATLLAVV